MIRNRMALGMGIGVALIAMMGAVNGVFNNITVGGNIAVPTGNVTAGSFNGGPFTGSVGSFTSIADSGSLSAASGTFGTGGISSAGGLVVTSGGGTITGTTNSNSLVATTGDVTANSTSGGGGHVTAGVSMTAPNFFGALTGNVTGNVSGNAGTATQFQTAPTTTCAYTTGNTQNGNPVCGNAAGGQTSGYQVLPNGFIIEWAQGVAQSTSGGTQNVQFPLTFPHACLSVQVSNLDPNPVDTQMSFFNVVSWSTTGTTLFLQRNADHGFDTITPNVLAIGY